MQFEKSPDECCGRSVKRRTVSLMLNDRQKAINHYYIFGSCFLPGTPLRDCPCEGVDTMQKTAAVNNIAVLRLLLQ